MDTSYGNPSLLEKLGSFASVILLLPFFLSWTLISSPFHRTNRHKTWTRVLGDRTVYFFTKYLNAKQTQWQLGYTLAVYKTFMKRQKLPFVIEELDEDTRLLWMGQKRTDRVILYFHGGGYILPVQDFYLRFWAHVQHELKINGEEPGFAILQYSLVPTARFPTQLKQAVRAVQHLVDAGVNPQNIQLTGDSAGANLILALFSHILHPAPNVPPLLLSGPIRSAYLMSPWVSINHDESIVTNDDSDMIGTDALLYMSSFVLRGLPDQYRPYMVADSTPEDWFANLSDVVERVLFTAGDAECLRDGIVLFVNRLRRGEYQKVEFMLQKYGVHDDPYLDFQWPEKRPGELTPVILDFFESGFDHKT